jgi:hypothetical protein
MVLLGGENLGSGIGQRVARGGESLTLLWEDTSKTKVNHLDSGIVRVTSEEKILERGGGWEREREREGRVRERERERENEVKKYFIYLNNYIQLEAD